MNKYAIDVLESQKEFNKSIFSAKSKNKMLKEFNAELQESIEILQGKVIAEGFVLMYPSGYEIGDKTLSEVNQEIFDCASQKVKLILQIDK